jgi:nicotinamide phosphoribosyltransferase
VIKNENGWQTIREDQLGSQQNQLQPIFRQGRLLQEVSFEQVRKRAEQH